MTDDAAADDPWKAADESWFAWRDMTASDDGNMHAPEAANPRSAADGAIVFSPGETYRPFRVTPTRLGFDEYDIANQGLVSHHFRVEDGRLEQDSVPFRYVWPAELDLMAELAGMRPRERWAGWLGEPLTSDSRTLVAVWEKPRKQEMETMS